MPQINRDDLEPEIQTILDKPVREGACVSEQPVCHSDARVTAQLTNEPPPNNIVKPWRIKNAFKGNLIMSPGGPSGLVGGLLKRLDSPQLYSHMGIMVEDHTGIRHVTSTNERIEMFYNGSILGIEKAPTDGIEEHALRFQWPGTITQTMEQAYITWLEHPMERDSSGNILQDTDGRNIPDQNYSLFDSITNKYYHIDALSFGPETMKIRDDEWKIVWPLVVQPCKFRQTNAVLAALHRIADATKPMRGHYRLYSYTRADIGLDENYFGPPMFETSQPDPQSDCTGDSKNLVMVEKTVPMMCSSFIWLAVQRANLAKPMIKLDGSFIPLTEQQCEERAQFQRMPHLGKIDPNTQDGLYFYDVGERQRAGTWLHDEYMLPKIRKTINEKLPSITGVFTLEKILDLLKALPLATVAKVLGVSMEVLKELIVLTSDMPDDVANQLCNAFASDRCETSAKDDDNWLTNPGVGYTVSPDNIINSWASPVSENAEFIHGLYGHNDRIYPGPPELDTNPPPPSTWQISQGFGMVEGQVFYKNKQGTKIGVLGANVRIGCTQFISGSSGTIVHRDLPSGRYWCVASYSDKNIGQMESKGQIVEIPQGGGIGLQIELIPPLDTRREVLIYGHMDLVNRYAFGKDWWDHPKFITAPSYLGLDYFPPDRDEFKTQREKSIKQTRNVLKQVDDWGQAEVEFDMEIQPDKSITVTYRARLKEADGDAWQITKQENVPPKQDNTQDGVKVAFDLVRSEMAWPVRAHIEFTIHNNIADLPDGL
ncbi:hypothetical protein [Bacillus thuringiensis]|uniref:hypothetical protein n=1 Tax=Bacillus thuringiensis TaxID=1428 RepID=UPI000BF56FF6|nr:hypothetical protein [Bacillus thuringiensis]PFU61981.1 hypothetical protein COK85_10225 [Bacillus thuringiensis]